jgi:hypothetical protein
MFGLHVTDGGKTPSIVDPILSSGQRKLGVNSVSAR